MSEDSSVEMHQQEEGVGTEGHLGLSLGLPLRHNLLEWSLRLLGKRASHLLILSCEERKAIT